MCDGTPCPCNLIEPTPEEGLARRLAGIRRRDRRADAGLRIITGACVVAMLAVLAAALRGVLGPVMNPIGLVLVAGSMLGVLVGVMLLVSTVPGTLRERHRRGMAAVRRAEGKP